MSLDEAFKKGDLTMVYAMTCECCEETTYYDDEPIQTVLRRIEEDGWVRRNGYTFCGRCMEDENDGMFDE